MLNNKKNLVIFYKRRWLRTLPLYFITLILVASLFNDEFGADFFKYLFFIQKTVPNFLTNDYYPVAWSLSIEEFFYLLFPLIIIFFGKKNSIRKIILFFIFLLIFKTFVATNIDSNFFRTGTFFRFDAILLGFILRFFYNNNVKYKFIPAIFLIFFMYIFYNFENFILSNGEDYVIKVSFILLLQIISVLTLITFTLFEPLMKINFIRNFSVLISTQTYSVYLIHIIFIYLFYNNY